VARRIKRHGELSTLVTALVTALAAATASEMSGLSEAGAHQLRAQ